MQKKTCPECSGREVVHCISRWSVMLDILIFTMSKPMSSLQDRISPYLDSFFDSALLIFFTVLAKIRAGKIVAAPQSFDTMRTITMWRSAKERGINVFQFYFLNRPINTFIATFERKTIVFEALPRPKRNKSKSIDWMDNKSAIKKIFRHEGLPTAEGGSFFSFDQALRKFKMLRKPVITKPSFGSRSRHTTIHINDEKNLKCGFFSAKKLSPWVILEEELQGSVFRISLIAGKVVAILRRDPPFVYGDGVRSIRELIAEENKNPKRAGVFHEIPIDEYVVKELEGQKLLLADVPHKGRKIALHPKVGRSQGGTNTAMAFSLVHSENIKLFERVAEVLGDPLIGVDFIIKDMREPWQKQDRCGIIECNSVPFLDLHHFPYEGEPVDAMGALWDTVFPNSSLAKNSSMES